MPCEPEPLKTRVALVADLFCGAGGSSTGARHALEALGFQMNLVAVNHWNVAIEIASEEEWVIATKSQYERSTLMYDGSRELIEIRPAFSEKDHPAELAGILDRNDCGEDRVPIDGDDLKRLKSIAGMRVDR